LRVSANGELALNQNPVGKNALVSLLTNMYATRNECVLYLWGDPGASYQDVIDAIDEVSEIKRPSPRLNLPVIDGVQVPETNLSKIDVRFVTPGALTVCEEGCYSLE